MALVELNVYPRRTAGKNANRRTRAGGRIPAVLYGNKKETEHVEVDASEFGRAVASLGASSIIFSLKQEAGQDEDVIALLREVQRNPVSDAVLHLDLFEIPRGVPITVTVPVEIEGEPLAVRRGEAVLAQTLDAVEVSCLPRDLPDQIVLDVSDRQLGDRIFVRDLQSPVGEIVTDSDTLVALLKAPTIFVEEEAEEAEGEEEKEGEEGEKEKASGEKASARDKGADD